MRILDNHRRLSRCCSHRLSRRLVRRTTRRLGGRWPNYLAQAFTAMRRSIRAHRNLIKLAPERFDHGVRDRLAREREEEDRRCAEYARAIARVYGTSEERAAEEMQRSLNNSRSGNGLETVWFSQVRAALRRSGTKTAPFLHRFLGDQCRLRTRRYRIGRCEWET